MGVLVRSVTALMMLLLLLAGCGGGPGVHQAGMVVRSSAPRAEPDAPSADTRALGTSNDEFAGRLYATLARDKHTFAFSPYSISVALAMASAGARGTTLDELEKGVPFSLPQPRLHAAFNAVGQSLDSRQGDHVRLEVANSLWGQEGTHFESPFLETLAADYDAGMQVVDYKREPEPARKAINEWVADRTQRKITELLGRGAVSRDTRLALINAVYFKAKWATAFDRGQTEKGPFHAPGGKVEAEFMHADELWRYVRGDGFRAVELPYRRGEVAMDVILPDPGKLAAIERRVAGGGIGPLLDGLAQESVALALPKLDFSSSFELVPALRELGVTRLFTGRADLSGVTHDEQLFVSAVAHQATLAVDEKGTEAAAATGITANATSANIGPTVTMNVDRPFILAIRDRASGQILFLARVADPTKAS